MPNRSEEWTLESIVARLNEIREEGYIPIPVGSYRNDDGIVGQIIEREFGVNENNLSVRDLGTFELKGMRRRSKALTLCHKKPVEGFTVLEIFERFGTIRPSNRDPKVMKKKLFMTIRGNRINSRGFQIIPQGDSVFSLCYFGNEIPEFLSKWDLSDQMNKINRVILVVADSRGAANSREEVFHYNEAYLLENLKNLSELIKSGIIVMDLCIDQTIDDTRSPHDRGPHIRIPKSKILIGYESISKIL